MNHVPGTEVGLIVLRQPRVPIQVSQDPPEPSSILGLETARFPYHYEGDAIIRGDDIWFN
jgi:hypothetical protein